MSWWAWLLSIALISLLLLGLVLLLPLRIFVRYLRENRTDQISLRLKLGFFGLRCELLKSAAGEKRISGYLLAGRIKIPAGFLPKVFGPDKKEGRAWWETLSDKGDFAVFLKAGRQARSLLKTVTWSHFDLELSWGWDDPAWTGLAAGGAWALGSILIGLLHEYFLVAARPRFRVLPVWGPAGLRLRWEGEVLLSLYCYLKLWRVVKKIGGVANGSSSH